MSLSTLLAATTPQILRPEHWDGRGVWWSVFPILWLLVIGGAVTTLVILGRRNRASAGPRAGEARLAERFASGEIDEQEYRERLAVLKGQSR
jgi:putative membrane protein